jgi:hypothetical protein
MFHAYFDDSKDALDSVVMVAAGWVAGELAWEGFNEAWDTALYRKGLTEFKAADCEGGYGEFKGRPDGDEIRSTLIALIEEYGLSGIAGAVNTAECGDALNRVRRTLADAQGQPSSGTKIPVGYLVCMQYCLVEAYRMTPTGQKLQVVFDKQAGASGRIPQMVQCLKRSAQFEAADRISDNEPQSKDSRSLPGLQAADLLAYETNRHAAALIRDQPIVRVWHDRLEPLVAHQQYFSGDAVKMIVAELVSDDFDSLL